MTYQNAAKAALAVQDAVNLSAVVHSFAEAVSALWDEAHATQNGTEWVNTHPVVTLYLDKLTQLNRYHDKETWQDDWRKVEEIAGRE